jgi:WG containing repeat
VDGEGNEGDALENLTDAKALKQGIYLVRTANGKQALIDNNYDVSKVTLSQLYDGIDSFYKKDVFKVRNGKKMGLIGLNGKTIFDAIYDNIEPTNVAGIYRIYQNKGVGLLDTTWTIKTAPNYESISDFNAFGLATAKSIRGSVIINSKDYKMSKFYEFISDYNEFGVSTVRNEVKLYGLVDTNLNIVVAPKYSSIGFFNEIGLAPACYPDGKCGFIKYDGTEQIKANYEAVGSFNAYGLMVARTAVDNCGVPNSVCKADVILDRTGNVIVPVNDESIKNKLHYELTDSLRDERYIVVNVKEDKSNAIRGFLLIQKDNLQLITPSPYQELKPMDILGNIRVQKAGKWGIIDSMGRTITKPIYKEIRRVNDSYYAAQNDKEKWGYLNKKGKPQIPFEYDEVRNYRFGFAPVSKGKGKWGLISRFNAKVVPCAFRSVGLNAAETKFEISDEDNTTFVINDKGECETNCPKFEDLRAKANKASETTIEKK